ncbi:hypothetical protein CBS147353_11509 [Aspergillus niger]|nr:hypothetical protein CBS147353_11509 [Aspergillus niger]
MPSGSPCTGRAETRTPEPADRAAYEKSPPRIRPKRTTRPPISYAREQEEENEASNARSRRKRNHEGRQRSQSDASAGREATTPDDTPTDVQELESTKLLQELIELREELKRRDEAHREELQRVKTEFRAALAEVQQELRDLKNTTLTPQGGSEPGSQSSYGEILQELQSLRSAITTSNTTSGGLSWAQVAADGDRAQPTTAYPLPNNKKQNKEDNCIRVSTKPNSNEGEDEGENTFRRYLPPRTAVTHIQDALATANETKDVRVLGVGTTITGGSKNLARTPNWPDHDSG